MRSEKLAYSPRQTHPVPAQCVVASLFVRKINVRGGRCALSTVNGHGTFT